MRVLGRWSCPACVCALAVAVSPACGHLSVCCAGHCGRPDWRDAVCLCWPCRPACGRRACRPVGPSGAGRAARRGGIYASMRSRVRVYAYARVHAHAGSVPPPPLFPFVFFCLLPLLHSAQRRHLLTLHSVVPLRPRHTTPMCHTHGTLQLKLFKTQPSRMYRVARGAGVRSVRKTNTGGVKKQCPTGI